MSLSETSIIDVFRRHFAGERSGLVLGIGDDAAVTSLPAGRQLVTATDSLVEGTHFLPGAAAASVGHRVLAVNLSDLAAMGAEAHWATLSLSIPNADGEWVGQFAKAFAQLADEFGVMLVGGDTVRGPLSATVTLMGSVPTGQFVTRNGACAGDDIYLSGAAGYAAAGRAVLSGKTQFDNMQSEEQQSRLRTYCQRFEYPLPRVAFGVALRTVATAMIDVSDGVHIDLSHLLTASNIGAHATVPELGLLATDFDNDTARELFFCGGEDYELCFCAPAESAPEVLRLAAEHAVPVTRIGKAVAGSGLSWNQDGRPVAPAGSAFEHFQD